MLACLLGCGYSLHRDAPWGQRRQPKAHSPASTQAGCIPTSFSSKPTPSPICLVGLIMGAGVPGIAWLEQSALLLLLAALVLIAVIAPLVWRLLQGHKTSAEPAPRPTRMSKAA